MNVSPIFTVLLLYPGLHPLQRLKFLQVQMTNFVWHLLLNHVNKTKTAVQVSEHAGFWGSVSISDDVFQVCWQCLWLLNISEGNWWDGYSFGFRGGEFSIFLELLFFFWSGVAEHTITHRHQAEQRALRDSSMKINIIHIDWYNVAASKCTLDLMRIVMLRKCLPAGGVWPLNCFSAQILFSPWFHSVISPWISNVLTHHVTIVLWLPQRWPTARLPRHMAMTWRRTCVAPTLCPTAARPRPHQGCDPRAGAAGTPSPPVPWSPHCR